MDLCSSSKSTSALASMPRDTGTILEFQVAGSSARNEKATTERKDTADKVTGSSLGIKTDISTLLRLPRFLQVLLEKNNRLNILHSLCAELLFRLTRPYNIVPKKLRMIHVEIAKLVREHVSPFSQIDNADLIYDGIFISFELLKHRSACLYQEVDTRLKGTPRPAMNHKMDIPTGDHGLTGSNYNCRGSLATRHTVYYGRGFVPNARFYAILPTPIVMTGVLPIPLTVLDSSALNEDPCATPSRLLAPIALVFRFRRGSSLRFLELWIFVLMV